MTTIAVKGVWSAAKARQQARNEVNRAGYSPVAKAKTKARTTTAKVS